MIKELKQSILNGEFEEAKECLKRVPKNMVENDLVDLAYDTENISVYLFVLKLLFEQEDAYLHCLASTIMSIGFSHVSGAYHIAYHHMIRAVELEPLDYSYKEGLLLFYRIPERLLSREDAVKLAQEILKDNPDSASAKSVLRDIF